LVPDPATCQAQVVAIGQQHVRLGHRPEHLDPAVRHPQPPGEFFRHTLLDDPTSVTDADGSHGICVPGQ